jgi:plasmid stabilization system protein ParE
MTYRLQVLPRAEADINQIFLWLQKRSPDGARRWFLAFEQAAQAVLLNPHRFSVAREEMSVGEGLRQFLFRTRHGRTYRGLFVIDDNEVVVLRVRGPGQRDLQSDELTQD